MTIHLPEDLANSIRAEVLSGHFPSEDEMVAAAVRDYLRRIQGQARLTASTAVAGFSAPTENEMTRKPCSAASTSQVFSARLSPPITDLALPPSPSGADPRRAALRNHPSRSPVTWRFTSLIPARLPGATSRRPGRPGFNHCPHRQPDMPCLWCGSPWRRWSRQ